MIPIVWQENIKDENTINYVGSAGRYSDIIEYYSDPFDRAKHIFHTNLSFCAGTFKESEELFRLLFKQFLIDICKTSNRMLKSLQPLIRLEGRSIYGYIADVEVFRTSRDSISHEWIMKILPIIIRADSIEEGKKIIEKKLNLAIDSILQELIKIN